jgi:hypothetical protein
MPGRLRASANGAVKGVGEGFRWRDGRSAPAGVRRARSPTSRDAPEDLGADASPRTCITRRWRPGRRAVACCARGVCSARQGSGFSAPLARCAPFLGDRRVRLPAITPTRSLPSRCSPEPAPSPAGVRPNPLLPHPVSPAIAPNPLPPQPVIARHRRPPHRDTRPRHPTPARLTTTPTRQPPATAPHLTATPAQCRVRSRGPAAVPIPKKRCIPSGRRSEPGVER